MARYRDTIRDRVRPHARDDAHVGLHLAGRRRRRSTARLIRYHTTLRGSAQEIHEIGLEQIEKLAGEYRVLGQEVLGTDDVPADLHAGCATTPALHHTNGADIVAASKAALAKATARDGRLVRDPAEGRLRRRGDDESARSPSTSRRPRTAAAAASSS